MEKKNIKKLIKKDKENLFNMICKRKRGIYLYYMITRNQHYLYYKIKKISRVRNYLRKNRTFLNKILLCFYDIRYNALSRKINVYLGGEFGENLRICHQNVIVNEFSKMGDNVVLHGNNCIGNGANGRKESATIGNNVNIGYGTTIIGDVKIANNIKIGANSLVNKSFLEEGIVIAGVPAKKIK